MLKMLSRLYFAYILILFGFYPSTTFSDWKFIARSSVGDEYYIDISLKHVFNSSVINYELVNFNEPVEYNQFSMLFKNEYDCKNKYWRPIYGRSYEYKNLQGRNIEIFNLNQKKWNQVDKDSVTYTILLNVCKFNS